MRKLATIRTIDNILPMDGYDNISLAQIDGWTVIVKNEEFTIGSKCVFLEIDSFLPNLPIYSFLGKPTTYLNRLGHRLRTKKLKSYISQGLALPLSTFPEITTPIELDDVTELLNIIKYDNSTIDNKPGIRTGNPAGRFPSFIPKTDQERIQNLVSYFTKNKDVAYEETLKLDGSSCTMYKIASTPSWWERLLGYFGRKVKHYHFGVCSRNLEIKPSSKRSASFNNTDGKASLHEESNFWQVADRYDLENRLPVGFAVQGELIGPRIQANHEKVSDIDFYIFDVYNITESRYLTPEERFHFCLDNLVGCKHVPIVNHSTKIFEECPTLQDLLARVKGQSINPGTISEGRVYKAVDGSHSFKCINNDYLLSGFDD